MASFEVVTERQAPPKPATVKRHQEQMRTYEGYVASLKKAQAGRLAPSPDETTRSVMVRVRRAASRLGRSVEVWSVGETVYFRPK